MGSTCGGVGNACCSTDLNVDIRNQVEGEYGNAAKGLQGSAAKGNRKSNSFHGQKQ